MKFLPRRRTTKAPKESPTPDYTFCEDVGAGPVTPWHIRKIGDDRVRLGGGIPGPALCGSDLHGGWDRSTVVTPENVAQFAVPRSGDGRIFACRDCADTYLAQVDPSTTP